MQTIESITNNIISDQIIQNNLVYLNEDNARSAIYKRDIYQALYPYTFYDTYIKSINVILNDGSIINMGSSVDLANFDTNRLNIEAEKAEGRILWEAASKPGKEVTGVRILRQLKFLDLKKLATLYIIVDMEQLIKDSLEQAGYSKNDDFVLLANKRRIYPDNFQYDELYSGFLSNMEESNNQYHITDFNKSKKFIITGSIPYADWNYMYFREYDSLFRHIQTTKFGILLFSALSIIIALLFILIIFRQVLKHLDFLVEKIHCFGSASPVRKDITQYDYEHRLDEIGQLHRSFDEMTRSVKVLRDENYDKQILLRDATIKILQQQINPHFLYNSLDTINCMAQQYGADDISLMVCSLGNLFRAAINVQDDLISLGDELNVLNNYTQIQRIRFKDRLDFKLVIPEDISHIFVPRLCIQPLVENAMKHALEYSDELCTIEVAIWEHEENHCIKVANTGSHFEEDLLLKIRNKEITQQGSGVGLVNIDSRMKLLYGDRYGLNFYNKDGLAIVSLLIPKERGD